MHQVTGAVRGSTRKDNGFRYSGQVSGPPSIHITVKELPIVVAYAIWGKHWRCLTVKCNCDNAAVVTIINSGRSNHASASVPVLLYSRVRSSCLLNICLGKIILLQMPYRGITSVCSSNRCLRPRKIHLHCHRNSCRCWFCSSPIGRQSLLVQFYFA